MGSTGAQAIAAEVSEGNVSLAAAVHWHLRSNHFPPVELTWLPVALDAIEAANDGDWDETFNRPPGYDPEPISAAVVIEGLHLESFITDGENLYHRGRA